MSQAKTLTTKSAEKRGVTMLVIGTVTNVRRHHTGYGNTRLLVDVMSDDTGFSTRLKYIQVRQPIPARGDHVAITGVPLNLKGRKPGTNIGAVNVTIN